MVFIGIFNLLMSKLILKYFLLKEHYNEKYTCFVSSNKEKNYCEKDINMSRNDFTSDSLYLINDFFSLYCLDYINGFIDYQIKCYYFDINNNYQNIKKYNIINNNYFWCFLFFVSIFIGNLGIYINEFICIFISIYITKIMMNNFCKLYHIKICRILNIILMFRFLSFIPAMSKLNDIYMTNLLLSITNLNEVILLFSFKFTYLLSLLYYIISSNFSLYIDYNIIQPTKVKQIKDNNETQIYNLIYVIIEIILLYLIICLVVILYNYFEIKIIIKVLYLFAVIILHSLKIQTINEIKGKKIESDFNIYIFVWIIISLRLIKLSGSQISLIYLINHLNLIVIINYYILNDKKRNNIFKIVIIFLLAIGYYFLNSSIFIIDAIAIIISPLIKKHKNNENTSYKIKNREQKLKNESIRVYNRLTFLFLLSILFFFLFQIGYANNYELSKKFFKELIDNINVLFEEIKERRVFNANEEIEFYIISKLL
jgi:hypothetical protein